MKVSVHQPQYLPWLGYFDKIDKSDCFVVLDTVQYKNREFQNRNKIRTKEKWIWLTVPVKTKGASRQKICDVLIDNSTDWKTEHRRSLEVWYGGAPFFKDYFPFFKSTYEQNWYRLIDLNLHIIKYLLGVLQINTKVLFESEIGTTSTSTRRIIEICQKLKANTYLSGSGGKNYLEEDLFNKAGIELDYQDFQHPTYQQQFERNDHTFTAYLSVIDLLFNHGQKSKDIIREGKGKDKGEGIRE
jgi:hypothetical protein